MRTCLFFKSILIVAGMATGVSAAYPATDQPRGDLESRLRSQYMLTRTAPLNGAVISPGSVLILQRNDIRGGPAASSITPYPNNYENGRIKYGVSSLLLDQNAIRLFAPGDRVFLTKIDCKDNSLNFLILSVDSFDVGPISATLAIKMPKGYLNSMAYEQVMQKIGELFVVEGEQAGAMSEMYPASMEPPPMVAPPAPPPLEVTLGQTESQVMGILGRPDKVIRLGGKAIFVYQNLKITFEDGRVTDVQ